LPAGAGRLTLDDMGVVAGASLTCDRGLQARVVLAGRATDVGGPSERSAYECRVGCAREVGGGVRVGR